MKGIILAGGNGTRLYPLTTSTSKQLLPVYDKPMVYYPLSVLMLAGIRDILLISTPNDIPRFQQLLGDGSHIGLNISYEIQYEPKGLAEALTIGEPFIGRDRVMVILGDNLFYGQGFTPLLQKVSSRDRGATIFAYPVKDPKRFGVVAFDSSFQAIGLEEKPENPRSNYAITGLYAFDNQAVALAKQIHLSPRGEYEMTDVLKHYLKNGNLHVEVLGRGFAWLDTGTHKSLLEASQFIETIEERQGLKVACLEEIAYRKGYISEAELMSIAETMKQSEYGQYLLQLTRLPYHEKLDTNSNMMESEWV